MQTLKKMSKIEFIHNKKVKKLVQPIVQRYFTDRLIMCIREMVKECNSTEPVACEKYL